MTTRNRPSMRVDMLSTLLPLLTLTLLLSTTAAVAHAQDNSLREGTRVRLETQSRRVVGIVKSLDADSVRLYTDENGAMLSLARNDVTGIRVSRGKSARAGAIRGAMWGTAIGALAAGILIIAVETDDTYQATGNEAAYFALNSLIGGAVWGAGIGAFVKKERWETVSFRPRVTSSASGVRLGIRLQPALLH
jgi:hypothetical protein